MRSIVIEAVVPIGELRFQLRRDLRRDDIVDEKGVDQSVQFCAGRAAGLAAWMPPMVSAGFGLIVNGRKG